MLVAPASALRGGQEPAGPILIGYRFKANKRRLECQRQWSPHPYVVVYSYSSLKEHFRSFDCEYALRPT
jgi:hypothetical protein